MSWINFKQDYKEVNKHMLEYEQLMKDFNKTFLAVTDINKNKRLNNGTSTSRN